MASVEIRGLREFQRELRRADKSLLNELRKVHRKVSDLVGDRARAVAGRSAGGIKSRATSKSAYLDTVATKRKPYVLGDLWGMKRRSGWYAAKRYENSSGRQFEKWVGNQWDPGETGGEPYHIGPAIDASLDEVDQIYLEGIDDLARRAFPD